MIPQPNPNIGRWDAMTEFSSKDLWLRIKNFEFGSPDASLSFCGRLARENGWDAAFADRIVEEYRRFCFLAMTAGHPVTPSEEVDQAWHLHLLYSENYWSQFCGTVLKRPFHHGPTRGGRAEGRKYCDWYQATLDSYRRVFGSSPPADIWPDAASRFQDADQFRRINTATHWVIAKPTGRGLRRMLAPAIGLPVLVACAAAGDGAGLVLPAVGGIVALIFAVGYIDGRAKSKRPRKPKRKDKKKDDGDGGCGSVGCGGCGSPGKRRGGKRDDDAQSDDAGVDSGCGGSGCGGGCGGCGG